MTEVDAFALISVGRKCTGCGDPRVVMVSLPRGVDEGEALVLERVAHDQRDWLAAIGDGRR